MIYEIIIAILLSIGVYFTVGILCTIYIKDYFKAYQKLMLEIGEKVDYTPDDVEKIAKWYKSGEFKNYTFNDFMLKHTITFFPLIAVNLYYLEND